MHHNLLSSPRFIFLIALALGGVALLNLRRGSAPTSVSPSLSSLSAVGPGLGLASATSIQAAYALPPLSSLGPQWTFVRQTILSDQDKVLSMSEGASPVRESVVKLIGKNYSLVLDEFALADRVQLLRALQTSGATKTVVAGRSGYFAQTADITGSTGLLLVGDTTALLLRVDGSALWPTELAAEVINYIASVRVP